MQAMTINEKQIELENDILLDISNVESYTKPKVENEKILLSSLMNRLQSPKITNKKGSAGGFIGGWVDDKRSNENVRTRSMLTFDIDNKEDALKVRENIENKTDFSYAMYSTHRSTPDTPRYRLIIPFRWPIATEQYKPVSRYIASDELIDITVDNASHTLSQLMNYPTCSEIEHYEFYYRDLNLLDVNSISDEKIEEFKDKPINHNPVEDIPQTDDDERLLMKIRNTKVKVDARDFPVLFDKGDISNYESASHADYALAKILAKHTGNIDQIERLMRDSALYRDKWNEHPDYLRERTIKNALQDVKGGYGIKSSPEDDFQIYIVEDGGTKNVEVNSGAFFNENDKFLHHKFATFLVENFNIISLDDRLHIYEDGRYVTDQKIIKRSMIEIIDALKDNQIKEVMERIKLIAPVKKHSDTRYIGVKNGVYDIKENKLLDNDPSFIITNQLNASFNPNAKSEAIESLLKLIGNDDKEIIQLLKEMIGYTLYRSNSLEKIFILLGGGGNGKSTLLNALGYLHGSENIEALSIQQIGDKFSTGLLHNKTLNIGDDIPFTSIKDTSTIKKVSTGQRINAEFKGQDGFSFENFSKLIFTTNKLPRFYDNSQGFNDRFIIVPLKAKIRNTGKQDHNFKDKLKTEESKSHLLSIGIEALNKLLKSGRFTIPYVVEQELEEFKMVNDPIGEWLNEYEEYGKDIHNMPINIAFNDYKNFCSYNGNTRHLTKKKFSMELRQHGYTSERIYINGNQVRAYQKTNEQLANEAAEGKELLHYSEHNSVINNIIIDQEFMN